MTDRPPLWGVPAWTGPDSPQSSVPLCPVCLHPAGSPAHYEAVARLERRTAEMRKRDAEYESPRDADDYPPCPPAGEFCRYCGTSRGCDAPSEH